MQDMGVIIKLVKLSSLRPLADVGSDVPSLQHVLAAVLPDIDTCDMALSSQSDACQGSSGVLTTSVARGERAIAKRPLLSLTLHEQES